MREFLSQSVPAVGAGDTRTELYVLAIIAGLVLINLLLRSE